jgi:flagellin
MRINTNVAALNTYGKLNAASAAGSKSMERLSSGLRINRAADDAAGLAISEKMRAQIRGLDQAKSNAQDGVSMIQTAEGAMNTQHSILQRMRELSVQASNSTYTDADKQNIQEEMNQLIDEVDRIANTTEFNNSKLLNGQVSETSKFATASGGDVATVAATANSTTGTSSINVSAAAVATATGSVFSTGALEDSAGVTASGATKLTNLFNSSSSTLNLEVGDEITISGVVGSEIKNSTFVVTKDSTLDDFMASVQNTLGAKSVGISAGTNYTPGNAVGLDGGAVTAGALEVVGEAGAAFDISSLKITAQSELGASKTAFNDAFSGDAASTNGGLMQNQVAANVGDRVAIIDLGTAGATPGDAAVAVRANATVEAANLELTFNSTLAGGASVIKVGARDQSAQIQIGANEGQSLSISINSTTADALGLRTDGVNLSVMTEKSASEAITTINDAINTVSSQRSKLGALQNRLEYTTTSLSSTAENMTAAESRIRDVDMAQEMMQFTKNNILAQAAQSMLAQANQQPQQVLQLLR